MINRPSRRQAAKWCPISSILSNTTSNQKRAAIALVRKDKHTLVELTGQMFAHTVHTIVQQSGKRREALLQGRFWMC